MLLGIGPDGPVRGRRVAITGIGTVSCCGVGADALWAGLNGPPPVGERRVPDFDPEVWFTAKEARQVDRFTQFAVAATTEALEDAGELGCRSRAIRGGDGNRGRRSRLPRVPDPPLRREGRTPGLAATRADDDVQRRCRGRLHPARLARTLRDRHHRVRGRGPQHRRRRASRGLGALRRCHRRSRRGRHDQRRHCRLHQHDRSVDLGRIASLRHPSRRVRHHRRSRRPGARGVGPRRRPRRADLRRAVRLREHRRRPSHHRADSGRIGCRRVHGARHGGCRRRRRPDRPHQRARDLHSLERSGRGRRHHQGVRQPRAAGDVDQGHHRPRTRRERRHRGRRGRYSASSTGSSPRPRATSSPTRRSPSTSWPVPLGHGSPPRSSPTPSGSAATTAAW